MNHFKSYKYIKQNFKFDCGIRKKRVNEWVIYISSKSFKDFSLIIEPYVVPSMKYKLYNINKTRK